jgi:4-alpha-glucanotransferase
LVTRRSGLAAPLFSLTTTQSWGIGEFRDFAVLARWAAEARQALIQILPIMELPLAERSPYSALSSMALDPIYIALPALPDFEAIGGELAFSETDRLALDQVRRSPRVEYAAIRRLKHAWLRRAFDRFVRLELARATPRARSYRAFVERERWWLEDYAVFRSLLAREGERAWWDWPADIKGGGADIVARAQIKPLPDQEYRQYLQWVAAEQWAEARRLSWPTRVLGDVPFMISGNSAEVWRRQDQFHLDATVGAPPDAFAEDGQDWGLPPWRWRTMRDTGFEWMRHRARRHADLFDGFRLDHLVGLYRAWIRPVDRTKSPYFEPADQAEQRELGETLVRLFTATGAEVIAEDLGTVPDFVRESIAALGVPGFKVLRFERAWNEPDQPALDPAAYPELSVATTGTHDLDSLGATLHGAELDEEIERLLGARSALTLLPLQDAFGWPDRINVPSVVSDENWTWKAPRPVDTWLDWDVSITRLDRLREMTRVAGR